MSYIIKFIFRNWWRNKLFFVISVVSLAIGLACANLLLAFVIYESNIEADNTNKDHILYMNQPFPMDTTQRVSYISGSIPEQLKNNYPDIEDYVRLTSVDVLSYSIDNNTLSGMNMISTDASFPDFFPYESLYGDLSKVFSSPDKIAITETFAKQILGDSYPIGQIIRVCTQSKEEPETDYEIVAVIRNRRQSLFVFDAITLNRQPFHGGVALLLTNKKIDREQFSNQLKADGVPTLMGDVGQYSFTTIQETYFSESPNESLHYIKRQQRILLYTGWIAAVLILLIACINYTNLNYTRLLEQIKFIKVQRLIGASSRQVGMHLFTDTFLTLIFSFLLSILIAHDLIPVFNSIVSGRLNTSFFFSAQVFPVIIFSLILFAIAVAMFMSYRLIRIPIQITQQHYNLQKKQRTIRNLSIIQYTISLALVITAITVHRQLSLVRQGGDSYQQVFEIGSYKGDENKVRLFVNKISELTGIESITTAGSSLLHSMIRQIVIKDEHGNESYSSILVFRMSTNFTETLSLNLLQGLPPEEAFKTYAQPVYVNEEFIRLLVPEGENPVGKLLDSFDKQNESTKISTIAGIISGLHTSSFENRMQAQAFHLDNQASLFAQIRLSDLSPQLMKQMEAIWKEVAPQEEFVCNDVFQQYMERNKKLTEFYNLLMMYAMISLFLTAFGLFGTAYYTTIQRTKEIGIRRVNGATGFQILLLLNRRFFKWIGVALIISIPPIWLLLQEWLQFFIYRIKITPDIFIIAGVIVSVITLIAVSWHSYRAVTRNPVKALKSE